MVGNLLFVDQLDNALAALTSTTRAMVQAELEKALHDTTTEFRASKDVDVREKLLLEAHDIGIVLNHAIKVSKEYDDIIRKD